MSEGRTDTNQLAVLAENGRLIEHGGMAGRYYQTIRGRIAQLAQQRQVQEAERLRDLMQETASYLFIATHKAGQYGTEVHYFLSRYFEQTAQVVLGSAMQVCVQNPDNTLFIYDPFTTADGYLSQNRVASQIGVFLPTCKPETADIITIRRQQSNVPQPPQYRQTAVTAKLPPASYWRMPGQYQ